MDHKTWAYHDGTWDEKSRGRGMITYKNRELVYFGGWHNLDPDGLGILAGPDGIVTQVNYAGGYLLERIRCI